MPSSCRMRPKMRGVLRAAELLRERPVGIVAHEDAGAVAIEGQRPPVGGAERVKQGAVAVQVLGGAEDQGQAGAGSVVDRPMQGQDRAAVLEPGEEAGVELYEGAHLSFGRAAGADLTAAPAAGGGP